MTFDYDLWIEREGGREGKREGEGGREGGREGERESEGGRTGERGRAGEGETRGREGGDNLFISRSVSDRVDTSYDHNLLSHWLHS